MLFFLSFSMLFFPSFSNKAGFVSSWWLFLKQIPLKRRDASLLKSFANHAFELRSLQRRGCARERSFPRVGSFLHRYHQQDETAQIIPSCRWPPGSFSSCQFLVPLGVWGFRLLWMTNWVMHPGHLQSVLSTALLSLPSFPSLCAAELASKHPHDPGIKRKENFVLWKNSHHFIHYT